MRITLALALGLVATFVAHAGVKVTKLDWTPGERQGHFVISLDSALSVTPDWDVNGGRLAITIPNASIEKNTVSKHAGARVAAANVNSGVLATLTLDGTSFREEDISLNLKDGRIEVVTRQSSSRVARAPSIEAPPAPAPKAAKVEKKDLGEDFLKKLEAETQVKPAPVVVPAKALATDEVRVSKAAPARESSFSFVTYAGKFTAFLGCVLLFFWGITQFMKKGFLGKGKLGFLNNSQLVSVLSTTYIAPKRSLLLVKAHNQAFLVSSSEAGLQLISEVRDVPGLVKEGEKFLTGTNFDESVDVAENSPASPALEEKVDIYASKPLPEEKGVQRDLVRFSDELKKKVKNLKALQ